MKKRLALVMAMMMSLGTAVPAMAATKYPTQEEARSCFELTNSVQEETGGYDVYVETPEPFRLGDWDPELPYEEWYDFGNGDYKFTEQNDYYAIRPDTTFTLKNTAPKGKNVYVTASMQCYVDKVYGDGEVVESTSGYLPVNAGSADFSDTSIVKLEEGTYVYVEGVGFQLAQNGFEPSYRGERVEIQPGKSVDFSFVEDLDTMGFGSDLYQYDGNNMYKLTVSVHFPDQDYRWWFQHVFYNDEESIDMFQAPAEINDPEIYFTESEDFLESGIPYDFKVKNTGTSEIDKTYLLLTYDPDGLDAVQLFPMDIKLAPGETFTSCVSSYYKGLYNSRVCWLDFNDKAERDAFLTNEPVFMDWEDTGRNISRYMLDYEVDGAAWLKSLSDRAEK